MKSRPDIVAFKPGYAGDTGYTAGRIYRVRYQGFSLIESAIALAVLGLVALLLLAFWRSSAQTQVKQAEVELLGQAKSAMLAFAYTNARLPCPASDASGVANCASGSQVGFLPWQTLGLADMRAGKMKYGVYRKPNATAALDIDLGVVRDRLEPLLTVGAARMATVVGIDSPLGRLNTIDFCTALNTMSSTITPASTNYLYTSNGSDNRNIAFAIALPGMLDADGALDASSAASLFDGLHATQSSTNPGFESPTRPQSNTYDDKVVAMTSQTLFATLSCGMGVSAAAHAHFNAASAAQIMRQGMYDYSFLLSLSAKMAGAGIAGATATIAGATSGVATATSSLALAVAQTLLSYGSVSALIVLSTAAVVINAATLVAALASMATAIAAKVIADQLVNDFGAVVLRAETLALSIEANARAADASGF